MAFELSCYRHPDFQGEPFSSAPDAATGDVVFPGVAPEEYHAMSIFPEYFKIGGTWRLAEESRMDCVAVVQEDGNLRIVEFRNLKVGDKVVVGRKDDGTEGIFVHTDGFDQCEECGDAFAFRTGRSRETAYSRDYDTLYDVLRYEKENGYILWVLGPAVVFDFDSRASLASLIRMGYVDSILAGNALGTHDLEGALYKTALGQDIYTQEQIPSGHYHHLDLLNRARKYSSVKEFVEKEGITDGVMAAAVETGIPLVLAGSIRDDGPLPGVIGDVYEAQDAMRAEVRKATTVISLATQLHTIAVGNMAPSYRVLKDGTVRQVCFYTIDISEFAVNKLRDRGSLSVTSIVANVQDFLVHLKNNLCK
ncbi:hypothetical protein MASR2M79_23370 [Aminivibrio sp.]